MSSSRKAILFTTSAVIASIPACFLTYFYSRATHETRNKYWEQVEKGEFTDLSNEFKHLVGVSKQDVLPPPS